MEPAPTPTLEWQYAALMIDIIIHVGIALSSTTGFVRNWFPDTWIAKLFTSPERAAAATEHTAVVAERAATAAERVSSGTEFELHSGVVVIKFDSLVSYSTIHSTL